MSERTAVYRLYGVSDVLLYVGVSQQFGRRWQQHAGAKAWWPQVCRQTVDWYDREQEALDAEIEAILTESPVHNVATTNRNYRAPGAPDRPVNGPYAGSSEIGRMLGGLSRQRVQQLTSQKDFPAPYEVLKMGKVWLTENVSAWARAHGREIAD